MNDHIAVIESEEYAVEVQRLTGDPIIVGMYEELPPAWADFTSWNFMRGASDQYHERGGQHAHSIGGPARALQAIHNARKEA